MTIQFTFICIVLFTIHIVSKHTTIYRDLLSEVTVSCISEMYIYKLAKNVHFICTFNVF